MPIKQYMYIMSFTYHLSINNLDVYHVSRFVSHSWCLRSRSIGHTILVIVYNTASVSVSIGRGMYVHMPFEPSAIRISSHMSWILGNGVGFPVFQGAIRHAELRPHSRTIFRMSWVEPQIRPYSDS